MAPLPRTKVQAKELLVKQNVRLAKSLWPHDLSTLSLSELRKLSRNSALSIALGEIRLLEGRWYVTSAGLLRLAKESHCRGINVQAVLPLCNAANNRWVFKATVYKSTISKGFIGYGDADPSNVSPIVSGAEMRVAETRAVNRALRKAYGIGICSVEELGAFSSPPQPTSVRAPSAQHHASNGSGNGQPRLRDQLCVLIRQYNLDASLVKAYATDFCGTQALSGASRELVESFISHLATSVRENRDALVCKLNSYAQPQEVTKS
jgi:hypothetical protein